MKASLRPRKRSRLVQVTKTVDSTLGKPIAPYDERLLDKAISYWEQGDWENLLKLDDDELANHPDRMRLSLLVAAGYMQVDRVVDGRRLISAARCFGADKKLVCRILAMGVHNCLGRIAIVSGQKSRAIRHFEAAIGNSASTLRVRITAQRRIDEYDTHFFHVHQSKDEDAINLPFDNKTPPLLNTPDMGVIEGGIEQIDATLVERVEKQIAELKTLRDGIDSSLKKNLANTIRQIGAHMSLQYYFETEKFQDIEIQTDGWAVSSDFMLYLVRLIDKNNYDIIIEFGSGTSTMAIAKTISRIQSHEKKSIYFISFEHIKKFHKETFDQLEHAGLADNVQLELAPLNDWIAKDGTVQPYYSCEFSLSSLVENLSLHEMKVLVLVDGPPGVTCKYARYPAVPIILKYFYRERIDVLLDDYYRDDEKKTVIRWLDYIDNMDLSCKYFEIGLEKGAALIQINESTL